MNNILLKAKTMLKKYLDGCWATEVAWRLESSSREPEFGSQPPETLGLGDPAPLASGGTNPQVHTPP